MKNPVKIFFGCVFISYIVIYSLMAVLA